MRAGFLRSKSLSSCTAASQLTLPERQPRVCDRLRTVWSKVSKCVECSCPCKKHRQQSKKLFRKRWRKAPNIFLMRLASVAALSALVSRSPGTSSKSCILESRIIRASANRKPEGTCKLNFQQVDQPTCSMRTAYSKTGHKVAESTRWIRLACSGYSWHTGRNHTKFIRISCSRMEVEKQNPGLNSNCRPLLQIISLLAAGPGPIVLQLDQVGARGKLLVKD